jgi:hypothetical protein
VDPSLLANTFAKQESEVTSESVVERVMANVSSNDKMKDILKQCTEATARIKTQFLPAERSSMVTDDEINNILATAVKYMLAVEEQSRQTIRRHILYYLVNGLTYEIGAPFMNKMVLGVDWTEIAQPDPSNLNRLDQVNKDIEAVELSLVAVTKLQRKLN